MMDKLNITVKPKLIEHLATGTIFVCFYDDYTKIGIITDKEADDRVSGTSYWMYEDGIKSDWNPAHMSSNMRVFVLDKVEIDKNPLRSLLNWRARYEQVV